MYVIANLINRYTFVEELLIIIIYYERRKSKIF